MTETVKLDIPVRRDSSGQVICATADGSRVCVLSQRGVLFGSSAYCLPTETALPEDGLALPDCPIVAALEKEEAA